MPADRKLDCRCSPGICPEAVFEDNAFDNLTAEQIAERGRDVLAVLGEYANAVVSLRCRGMCFWANKDSDVEFAIDVPSTERGRMLMETLETVPVCARPVLVPDASDFEFVDRVATYRTAEVRTLATEPTECKPGVDVARARRGRRATAPATS